MMFDPLLLLAAAGGYLFGSIPFGLVLTRWPGWAIFARSARAISARPMCCAPAARIWRWPPDPGFRQGRHGLHRLHPAGLDTRRPRGRRRGLPGPLLPGLAEISRAARAWRPSWARCWQRPGPSASWRAPPGWARRCCFASPASQHWSPRPDPVWALAFGRSDVAILALFLAALIFWRHSANIDRILKGEEPKIGAKKA
jgi:hypothetical protein